MKKNERLMGVTRAQLRVKGDNPESRTITGYAIVFGQESVPMWEDRNGLPVVETINRSAVTEALLAKSDIRMTMYHDMTKLLARSKQGSGSLRYFLEEEGVRFEFDAPRTVWGDEALELVRNGDIDGCSFMFATDYNNRSVVTQNRHDDRVVMDVTRIDGLYDFTLTPDPAYPQTQCSARSAAVEVDEPEPVVTDSEAVKAAIREMREKTQIKPF